MSYALVEDVPDTDDPPLVVPDIPAALRPAANAACAAALTACIVAAARHKRPPESGPSASSHTSKARPLQTVAEAMDWCLLGLLEALPSHPLFPRIVDMPTREMYAVFGLRAAEFFHLIFGADSDFHQQYLTQCAQQEVVLSPWERQCREVRYRPRSFMPRKSTLEYQRYSFISPMCDDALGRAPSTIIASALDPFPSSLDEVFTFSVGLDAADAIGRGPHHLLLHCSTHLGDAQLGDTFRMETVFQVVEHPPDKASSSPMVEVFIKYGVNFIKGNRQQGKSPSVEQKQIEEQTHCLRKWVEIVNDRVTLYLKATGRLQPVPGVTPRSPPSPLDLEGQRRHFMLTGIPSRWKTPRGPCLSMDLGASDEESDRKGKSSGKPKNRFLRTLLGGSQDECVSLLQKPTAKAATSRGKEPKPDPLSSDSAIEMEPSPTTQGSTLSEGDNPPAVASPITGMDNASLPQNASWCSSPPPTETPEPTPCGSPVVSILPSIQGLSITVPPTSTSTSCSFASPIIDLSMPPTSVPETTLPQETSVIPLFPETSPLFFPDPIPDSSPQISPENSPCRPIDPSADPPSVSPDIIPIPLEPMEQQLTSGPDVGPSSVFQQLRPMCAALCQSVIPLLTARNSILLLLTVHAWLGIAAWRRQGTISWTITGAMGSVQRCASAASHVAELTAATQQQQLITGLSALTTVLTAPQTSGPLQHCGNPADGLGSPLCTVASHLHQLLQNMTSMVKNPENPFSQGKSHSGIDKDTSAGLCPDVQATELMPLLRWLRAFRWLLLISLLPSVFLLLLALAALLGHYVPNFLSDTLLGLPGAHSLLTELDLHP